MMENDKLSILLMQFYVSMGNRVAMCLTAFQIGNACIEENITVPAYIEYINNLTDQRSDWYGDWYEDVGEAFILAFAAHVVKFLEAGDGKNK